MAISLLSVTPKHERRLRLIFSDTLASGAFGASPSVYAVTTNDSLGISPTVTEAIVVGNNPRAVEIALGEDLAQGASHLVAAIGVPSLAGPVTDSTSQQNILFSTLVHTTNAESVVDAQDVLLYGTDLIWNGSDYQETLQGDLAVISGVANVTSAILRRCLASGLPWDPTYGPNARAYVNAADVTPLRGAIIQQVKQDNRVSTVTATTQSTLGSDSTTFTVKPVLVGSETAVQIPVTVK